MTVQVLADFPIATESSWPARSIYKVRRPSVRRARCAQRRNLPVLLRIFKLLSSSSSLHAFNFLLQFLPSTFCVGFGYLGRLVLPSISSLSAWFICQVNPIRDFFLLFCIFLLSIFLLFFRLAFFAIFGKLKLPGDPKIKRKLLKTCFGRGFLDEFHFC